MKKIVKKLMITGLMICTLLLAPAIMSYAAEGTLTFSDPTGKVGENILVKVKMEGGGAPIGDGQASITYDAAKLEFVSGTNATGGNGTIQLAASGTGAETELVFELTFKALAEGVTNIEVASSTAYLFSDETLNLAPGSAAVTVQPGDGTTPDAEGTENAAATGERQVSEANVEVLGTMYGIYENFTDALIPEGFSKTTIHYNGAEHNAIAQDASGEVIVYLVAGENDPVMALYNEEKDRFVIAEQIPVSEEFYVFVLSEGDGSTLPEQFQEAIIEINGTNFPAWQNMNAKDYYLVYALSSEGEKGYYEYDSVEGTYQRFVLETPDEKETKEDNPAIAKAKELVDRYFMILAIAGIALVLFLIILIIVLGVKLHRRNAEIDSYYDDYTEGDEGHENEEEDFFEDEDDDYEDDYDDDYDDEVDDDDFEVEFDDEDEDDDYDDEFNIEFDDEDEDEDEERKQKFDVEFIDL